MKNRNLSGQIRKWITFLFIGLGMGITFQLFAQKPAALLPEQELWDQAQDLFQKKKFGAARYTFERFITVSKDTLLNTEGAYYVARCAEELAHPDAFSRYLLITQQWPFHPKAASSRFHMGQIRFYSRNYKAALEEFLKVNYHELSEEEDALWKFEIGYSYFKINEYENALTYLALLEPESPVIKAKSAYYAGYIYYMVGKNKDAINKFESIIDHEVYGKVAHIYLSQLYYRLGDYTKVIELTQNNKIKELASDVQFISGMAHFRKGQMHEAVALLEPYALQQKALNDSVSCILGMAFCADGDTVKAISYLLKPAARQDNLGQEASYYLGNLCLLAGKKENARSAFYQASRAGEDATIKQNSAFQYAKISAEIQPGHPATLLSLQKYITDYPKSENLNEAREILSHLYIHSRQYARAIEALEAVTSPTITMQKQLATCIYLLAEEKFLASERKTAAGLYQKALTLPLDGFSKNMSNYRLGEMAFEAEKYQEAIQLFQAIPREGPLGAYYASSVDYELGYAYLKTGDYSKAIKSFEKFIQQESPSGPKAELVHDAWLRQADAFFMQRKYADAIEGYTYTITGKYTEADYAMYQKAIISGLRQNYYEKINILDRLVDEYPGGTYEIPALFELGFTNWVIQRLDEAIDHFDALIQKNPKTDKARAANLNIGLIFQSQHKTDKAIEQFRHIILSYPESEEGRQAISLLRDSYIEKGEKSAFDAFIKENRLGGFARLDLSEEDSLSYESALNALEKKDTAKAIRNFDDYLNTYPEGIFSIRVRFQRAEILSKQGKTEIALKDYEWLAAKPSHQFMERSCRAAASIHWSAARFRLALPFYQQAENIASSAEFKLQSLLGQLRCAVKLNESDAIKQSAPKILGLSNASKDHKIEASYSFGKAIMDNQMDKALGLFKEVTKGPVSAKAAESQYLISYLLFQKGDTLGTKNAIFYLIDHYPDYEYWVAKGFILLSDNYLRMNNVLAARQALQDVIEVYEKDPSDPEDVLSMAKEKLNLLNADQNNKVAPDAPQDELENE